MGGSKARRFVGWTMMCFVACESRTLPGEDPTATTETGPPQESASTREAVPVARAEESIAAGRRFDFEQDAAGQSPRGFTAARSGRGEPARWEVIPAEDAPSGRQVVAQLSSDATGYRFPLLILDDVTASDVELAVAAKPVSGRTDQAIGLVWRFRDPDNYYVVRANALEGNVVLYKMEGGKRSDLDVEGAGNTYGVAAEVPPQTWSRLRVVAAGDLFIVELGGKELFRVRDHTFPRPGKVGLWTKADSVTWFDDLEVKFLDREQAP